MNKIYRLNTNCINQQNYSRVNFYLLCYYICVNSIRNLKLVPNESLMNIMKKIDEIDLKFQEIYAKSQDNQNSNDPEENKNVINENKSEIFKKVKLTTKNLFTIFNFNNFNVINEKEIVEHINEYYNEESSNIIINRYPIKPRIRFNNTIHKMNVIFIVKHIF